MILFDFQIKDVHSGDKFLKTTKIAMQANLRTCDYYGNLTLEAA